MNSHSECDDCSYEKQKLRAYFYELERMRDFLYWLFEEGEVDWMTHQEAFANFEAWEDEQTRDREPVGTKVS